MRGSLLAVAFLALPLAGSDVRSIKAAWEWTTEERLQARFDPVAVKARIDAVMVTRLGPPGSTGAISHHAPGKRPADSIRGLAHPELLLSHEIFDTFISAAYRYDDSVALAFRRDAAEKAAALGLPSTFLDALRTESEQFIALKRREYELRDLVNGGGPNATPLRLEIKQVEAAQCPFRVDAMNRLRSKFGTTPVNRFLYQVVAPGVFFDFEEPQDPQGLRRREDGCR